MKQIKSIILLGILLCTVAATTAFAQTTVSGKVTSHEDKNGLPGVSVVIKNSAPIQGTTTDINGNYTISVPENATLVFSYTGMAQQEVSTLGQATIDVLMASASQSLSTVVVIGYGTASKEKLTGSVSAVSEGDFKQGVVTNASSLIAGKVAGVNITPSSGRAGDGNRIRIRGGASLNASNDPLIVIDGLPISNDGISGQTNALSSLNPNDIESMTFLKDASATAIYGSRASNGVIIITTKKGGEGAGGKKFNIDFQTVNSLATVARRIDVLDGEEFRTLIEEYGFGGDLDMKARFLGRLGYTENGEKKYANTDWQKEIFRPAFSSDNTLAISGKFPHTPYRLSLGYLTQDGLLKTDNMQRVTAAINVSPSMLKDHLKIDINLRGSYAKSHFGDGGAVGAALRMDPTKPVTASGMDKYNGYWQWETSPGYFNSMATSNPVSLLNSRQDVGHGLRGFGNIQADYKFHFLPELRANVNFGFDIANGHGTNIYESWHPVYSNRKGEFSQYNQNRVDMLFEAYLAYEKNFGKNHFDIMAGYTYQSWKTTNYNFPTLTQNKQDTVSRPDFPFDIPEHTLLSFYGRANYGYADKYLIQASIRADASSRFAKDFLWGIFPAASAAWVISKENFLADNTNVSLLKFRFGWGVTGQQEINNYEHLAKYNLSANTAMVQFGDLFYNMWRPDGYDDKRKWEQTTAYNVGFDYSFLKGRLYGSIDAYYKLTTDLLSEMNVAMGSNFTNRVVTNIGSMTAKGIEFQINYLPVDKEDLTVDLGLNVTVNRSLITQLTLNDADTSFPGLEVGGITGGTGQYVQIHSVGYTPYTFFVYKQKYDETGKPLEGQYEDLDGDGTITDKDRYRYKNAEPLLFLGFNIAVNWKNWSFSTMLRSNIGNYVYNNNDADFSKYGIILNDGSNYLQNATSDIYNTGFITNTNQQLKSDYYIQNASFLKMDYVSLGYTFNNLGGKQGMKLALNFTVQNVFTLTKYTGIDPEINGGLDKAIYPYPRTFSLGIRFNY